MNYVYVLGILSIFGGLLSAVSPLPARAAEPPQVVFTEINWAGSGRSAADEWLELGNLGGEPVDLSGWAVGGAATGGQAIAIADGTTIDAGSVLLVANYDPGESSTLAITPHLVTTALSLPNTKLELVLLMPDGTPVDSINDPGTPNFGSTLPTASMERDLATLTWRTAITSANLLDITQLGTPGLAYATSTEPVTEEAVAQDEEIITEEEGVAEVVVRETTEEVVTIIETDSTTEGTVAESPIDVPVDAASETPNSLDGVVDNATQPNVPTEETASFTVDTIVAPVEETNTPSTDASGTVSGSTASSTLDHVDITQEQTEVADEETTTIVDEASDATVTEVEAASSADVPVEEEAPVEDPILSTEPPVETTTESVLEADTQDTSDIHEASPASVAAEAPPTTGRVVLNEMMIAPSEGDEWIELLNLDTRTIDITGWAVRDASGKSTVLTGSILPGAYLVIEKPFGKLNNDHDIVELLDAAGTPVTTLAYGTADVSAPKKDETLSRTDDDWFVTASVTKGAANILTEVAVEEHIIDEQTVAEMTAAEPDYETAAPEADDQHESAPAIFDDAADTGDATVTYTLVATASSPATTSTKRSSTTKTSKAMKPVAPIAITSLHGITDGTTVIYEGTVIALPGIFGSQVAVVDGAILYMHSAAWPALAVGDVIRVTGETSTARGEQRIKLANASAVTTLRHDDVTALDITFDDLDAADKPVLVTVRGTILAREGSQLTLLADGHELSVDAHENTGITWGSLSTASLRITGVLRVINGAPVLMPRSTDDVIPETITVPITATTDQTSFPTKPLAGGALVTGSLGILGYWFVRSRTTLIPSV